MNVLLTSDHHYVTYITTSTSNLESRGFSDVSEIVKCYHKNDIALVLLDITALLCSLLASSWILQHFPHIIY